MTASQIATPPAALGASHGVAAVPPAAATPPLDRNTWAQCESDWGDAHADWTRP